MKSDLEVAIERLEACLPVSDRAALRIIEHPALTEDEKHDLLGAVRIQWDYVRGALRKLRRALDVERGQVRS